MKKKRVAVLLAVALVAVAGCGQGPEHVAPGDEPMSMEEHTEVIEGPGSAEEKVEVICQDMHNRGTFDDGTITPEEVGC